MTILIGISIVALVIALITATQANRNMKDIDNLQDRVDDLENKQADSFKKRWGADRYQIRFLRLGKFSKFIVLAEDFHT